MYSRNGGDCRAQDGVARTRELLIINRHVDVVRAESLARRETRERGGRGNEHASRRRIANAARGHKVGLFDMHHKQSKMMQS